MNLRLVVLRIPVIPISQCVSNSTGNEQRFQPDGHHNRSCNFVVGRDWNNHVGSRNSVVTFSDLLRRMSEERKLPNEFFPHHANLAREHREFFEQRLKQGHLPFTAICTSTLELGIDIGDVACVGQVGAPWCPMRFHPGWTWMRQCR